MGFGADLFSLTSTFCTSVFDIGSDLINSLDFLGHNVSRTLSDCFSKSKSFDLPDNFTHVGMLNETNKADSGEVYDVHQVWGTVGIFIMFLPGIINIPVFLVYLMNGRNMFKELRDEFGVRADTNSKKCEFLMFDICNMWFYPIVVIFGSFTALCKAFRGNASEYVKVGTVVVGLEAFYESFPQILLQCFVIFYGYEVTTVQKVTIFTSLFMLARVAIVYDFLWKRLSFKDTLINTAILFPAHATTIMFRVSAFTMTMVFLRGWAVIPIFALYLEMLAISYVKDQSVPDPITRFRLIWYRSLGNLAVLNVYSLMETHMDHKEKIRCRNFIIFSTIITFVHHVIVMTLIILLTFYSPEHFQHERFEKLIVKPGGNLFFYAFGVTYALGISSLALCLHLSVRVLNSRVEVLDNEIESNTGVQTQNLMELKSTTNETE